MNNNAYDEIIRKLEDELALLKSQTHDLVMLIERAMGLCENTIIDMREMVIHSPPRLDRGEVVFEFATQKSLNFVLNNYIFSFEPDRGKQFCWHNNVVKNN